MNRCTDHETSQAANGACCDNCPQILSVQLPPLDTACDTADEKVGLQRKTRRKTKGKNDDNWRYTVQKSVSTVERTQTNSYSVICARGGFTRSVSERTTKTSWEFGRVGLRPVESSLPTCTVCSTGWMPSRL